MPDGGGEGEDALQHPGGDAVDGAAAVALEVELGLEGVVDGLDDLPQWAEVLPPGWFRLALAGGPQQGQPGGGEDGLEVAAVVALVGDDDLPGPASSRGRSPCIPQTCPPTPKPPRNQPRSSAGF